MRKPDFLLFCIAAATFGLVVAAPGAAAAQDEALPEPQTQSMPPEPPIGAPEPTLEQQAEVATWPAEKQTEYQAWPGETQGYYWSLSPERRKLFWRLQDEDKIAITAMTGPERDAAWTQIESAFAQPDEG